MDAVTVEFGSPSKFSRFGKALSCGAAYGLYTQGTAFKFAHGRAMKFGGGVFSQRSSQVNKFGMSPSEVAFRQDQLQALQDRYAQEAALATRIQSVARGYNARKANRISPCPVCLDSKFSKNKVQPWGCERGRHSVCTDCAQSIAQSQHRACPMCRAAPVNDPTWTAQAYNSESESESPSYDEGEGSDDASERYRSTRRWSGDSEDWVAPVSGYGDREDIMRMNASDRAEAMARLPIGADFWHPQPDWGAWWTD